LVSFSLATMHISPLPFQMSYQLKCGFVVAVTSTERTISATSETVSALAPSEKSCLTILSWGTLAAWFKELSPKNNLKPTDSTPSSLGGRGCAITKGGGKFLIGKGGEVEHSLSVLMPHSRACTVWWKTGAFGKCLVKRWVATWTKNKNFCATQMKKKWCRNPF